MDAESETTFYARRQQMLRATFTFGAGPRTCIGKNISLLEIYKLVPSLFLRYKVRDADIDRLPGTSKIYTPSNAWFLQIELEHPEKNWQTVNAWFVRQKHMDVRLARHDFL
jgi:cytochrome P450